jgi:hypothetical protein
MSKKPVTLRPSSEEIATFRASGQFDEAWYVKEYADVSQSGMDAAEHYLWLGRRIGRHATKQESDRAAGIGLSWCIVVTPHVSFIGHSLAEGLKRHGWSVDVTLSMPDQFTHDYYIILCAQMFDRLPPGEKRIIYQLEQSASSRWFSDHYIQDMENSLAVLEYSIQNMTFLEGKGIAYPHVYYLPIGASLSYGAHEKVEKDIDLLFYGDYKSSPRRQRLLQVAESHFKVVRADTVFGDDIKKLIGRSKAVLNLHYYEGAQLEMPRVQECLSLGTPVVSEDSADQDEYEHLDGAVTFFETDNPDAMLNALFELVVHTEDSSAKVQRAVEFWQRRHLFMLDRFLIGVGILPTTALGDLTSESVLEDSVYALSLPETTGRREVFNIETRTSDTCVFDGIRRRPGWIGCGMSYKYLCRSALNSGVQRFTIMEDDVLLPYNHSQNMEVVHRYLTEKAGEWDIFSGVIAHLHDDTKVLHVEKFGGLEFITIDRMTSTVYNIYSRRAMKVISSWNQLNHDSQNNTIDRFLENSGLRIVVTDPYIVGHREDMNSTLWGFNNSQYRDMIRESQRKLSEIKKMWLGKDIRQI